MPAVSAYPLHREGTCNAPKMVKEYRPDDGFELAFVGAMSDALAGMFAKGKATSSQKGDDQSESS